VLELAQVSFVDADALAGLACFIASAADTATCRTARPSGEPSSGVSPASRTRAAAKGFR
jgi:hypothetical protein